MPELPRIDLSQLADIDPLASDTTQQDQDMLLAGVATGHIPESPARLLERMGTDAAAWAQELEDVLSDPSFRQRELGGLLISYFANAIEQAKSTERSRIADDLRASAVVAEDRELRRQLVRQRDFYADQIEKGLL